MSPSLPFSSPLLLLFVMCKVRGLTADVDSSVNVGGMVLK